MKESFYDEMLHSRLLACTGTCTLVLAPSLVELVSDVQRIGILRVVEVLMDGLHLPEMSAINELF